tara:strand:- start:999 stop:1358 length:360 start_codon:yes stop_codon:yes gene_type:complete
MIRVILLVLIIFLPLTVFGNDIRGSGWIFYEGDVDKKIILFEKDGTFTSLNVISITGSEGEVWGDSDETWTINGDRVVISYNNGYRICSLILNKSKDRMSGTCINKAGLVEEIRGKLIE